jgi:hypothetical protein
VKFNVKHPSLAAPRRQYHDHVSADKKQRSSNDS